jgi:hypothetical protein
VARRLVEQRKLAGASYWRGLSTSSIDLGLRIK